MPALLVAVLLGAGAATIMPGATRAREAKPVLTTIYQFPGGGDGLVPWGGLTKFGGTLYGATFDGGAYGRGSVFAINPVSGNEKLVYSFMAGMDAQMPQSGLLKVGSLLYGISNTGGANGYGAVYSVDPATGAEAVLFSFTPAMGGGSGATPIAAGNFLFGTTYGGGTGAGFGTVFKLDLKTNAETTLYSFTGGADGGSPQYGVTYAKGVLYGTATLGGSAGAGTLFSVNATTGAEQTLFTFDGSTHGGGPFGGVIDVGGVLYGDTYYGGSVSGYAGVVFSYTLASATEATIYNFTGGTDGGNPEGGLLYVGGTLYGTTYDGGASGEGTVFSLNPASGVLTTLYAFAGGANGGHSETPLIDVGGVLYGTDLGPATGAPDNGTVFKIDPHTGAETTLHDFRGASPYGPPNSALLNVGGTLYGTSGVVGADFTGTIYTIDPSTGAQNTVYSFTGGADGGEPEGGLTALGGALYGVSWIGGANQGGTIFTINPASGAQTVVYNFPTSGTLPRGPLVVVKGMLYGTTSYGGTSGIGSVFAFDLATKSLTTIHDFTAGADGGLPLSGLSASGGLLYGTAAVGGSASQGVVYQIDPATMVETVLHSFQGGTDGLYPEVPPVDIGGTLYGTTGYGGALTPACFGGYGCGVLYAINLSSGAYSGLHAFDYTSDGAVPAAALTGVGKTIYGSTLVGGASANGTLFSYVPSSGNFSVLYNFTGGADGSLPDAALTPLSGLFYGTAGRGAVANLGSVFSYKP